MIAIWAELIYTLILQPLQTDSIMYVYQHAHLDTSEITLLSNVFKLAPMIHLQTIQPEDAFLLALELKNYMLMDQPGAVFLAVLVAALVIIKIGLAFRTARQKYLDINWI